MDTVECGDPEPQYDMFADGYVPDMDGVVGICASLLTVDKESRTVGLVHYTTQEYFETYQSRWFPNASGILARTCIIYLSVDHVDHHQLRVRYEKWQQDPRSGSETPTFLKSRPLYDCAFSLWERCLSGDTPDIVEEIVRCSRLGQQVVDIGRFRRGAHFILEGRTVTLLHLVVSARAVGVMRMSGEQLQSLDAVDIDGDGRTPLMYLFMDCIVPQTPDDDQDSSHRRAMLQVLLESKMAWAHSQWLERSNSPSICSAVRRQLHLWHGVRCIPTRQRRNLGPRCRRQKWPDTPLLCRRGRKCRYGSALDEIGASKSQLKGWIWTYSLVVYCIAVDHRDVDGKSPLLLALTGSAYLIAAWAEVVANILIDTGEVDLDIKDSFGRTPLFHAALGNCRSIVQRLLASGRVDAGRRDTDGRTPLFFAINNFEIGTARQTLPSAIQQLLAHDHVDVNATDRYGCTPLIRAVARSAPHALELLLKRPDLHFGRGDEDGSTAFAIALREGNHDVIRLLREKYAEVGKQVPDMAEVRQQDDMEEGQETGP
ncbi:ankyrin repeat-containing domain protein [Coniochaeta sp. 2T2.1]|nr:ankyrin repeat-containing domain protein [Coniochaeta sp. 2T2.1]